MTKEEVQKLPHGVYRIYWKEKYGSGISVAAIGSLPDGKRWLAPANWVSPDADPAWEQIEHVELIEKMNYDQNPLKEDLTPTGGTYKVQIVDDLIGINGFPTDLSLSKLLTGLRECGYQITEPPHKSFLEIKEFLDKLEGTKCTDALGGMIYEYHHRPTNRNLTIAQLDSRTNVTIHNSDGCIFLGHVFSLDDFVFIWNRLI